MLQKPKQKLITIGSCHNGER